MESEWFERGVKEALHIRALQASLNNDGGWYKMPLSGITSLRRDYWRMEEGPPREMGGWGGVGLGAGGGGGRGGR